MLGWLLIVSAVFAQTSGLPHNSALADELARPGYTSRAPRFADYKVRGSPKTRGTWLAVGRCDQADVPGGMGYKRFVRAEARKNGPNFAGHCVVVVCSCGSGCGNLSVVDLRTGHVYPFPFVLTANTHCPPSYDVVREDVALRSDSSLLVIIGNLLTFEGAGGAIERLHGCAVRYFRWTGRGLVLIRKAPIR